MSWPRDAYVGQKVVSLCGAWYTLHSEYPIVGPSIGEVCEVSGINVSCGLVVITLTGYPHTKTGFAAIAFRPLEETGRKKSTVAAVEKLKRDVLGAPARRLPTKESV